MCMDLSLGFLFCSIDSFFVPVPYCLDDCGFVVEPEVRQVDFSTSILLSQDCFGKYTHFHCTDSSTLRGEHRQNNLQHKSQQDPL